MPEEIREVGLPYTMVESMMTELIAALMRDAAAVGHMPEHAVYQAMLVVQASARKAFTMSGIEKGYEEFAELQINHPL